MTYTTWPHQILKRLHASMRQINNLIHLKVTYNLIIKFINFIIRKITTYFYWVNHFCGPVFDWLCNWTSSRTSQVQKVQFCYMTSDRSARWTTYINISRNKVLGCQFSIDPMNNSWQPFSHFHPEDTRTCLWFGHIYQSHRQQWCSKKGNYQKPLSWDLTYFQFDRLYSSIFKNFPRR